MSSFLEIEAANFLTFVGAQRPKPDSVFFLVMGMTGSGKSSFIADCTGRDDVDIGHDLSSSNLPTGTNSVAIFRTELQERDVYLIDTPGFDVIAIATLLSTYRDAFSIFSNLLFKDTDREDVDILTAVSHYLSVSYANNVSVNGVLYLHRISDTRIGSSTRRNLGMLKALCGNDAFENVAIVTTMWSSNHSGIEHDKQCSREQELQDSFLNDMFQGGSKLFSHKPCQTLSQRRLSANRILAMLFDTWKDTEITLQIQHEMVNLKLTLNQSSAGRILEEEVRKHRKSFEEELETLGGSNGGDEKQRHRSRDELLETRSSEIRRILAENNHALDAMRLSLLEIHNKQEQRFIKQVSTMQSKWRAMLEEKEEEYRLKEHEYRTRLLHRQEEELNERGRLLQERQSSSRRAVAAEAALAYQRETFAELARQGHRQLSGLERTNRLQHDELIRARQRDQLLKEELKRLRIEIKDLKEETRSKLETTEKVKHEWVGPLLQGVATGGLGLVGTCITAGMLCCVQ
ncbi:hypothetical protein NPX13_g868 [Xylaria arbuscula]|uniref:G domain-containing protein n=1 Tax=Xylaria arbuscula TaxID=114810 RepID=A0A9W8NM28_9PEZI|nr:hypothetical protein NPX13_g868 [Xylaria arbuscula]